MSRYVIVQNDRREVVVGWDPPLGTFFAQEYDAAAGPEDDDLLWWIGNDRHEVRDIGVLENALRDQGWSLPPDVCAKLMADKQAPWEPGPMQKFFGFTG